MRRWGRDAEFTERSRGGSQRSARGMVSRQGKGMIDADEVSERALFRVRWKM